MPKKQATDFGISPTIPTMCRILKSRSFELEISQAPKDPEMLAQRLRNNTAASPADAGGDLDAAWEDVNDSGSETVAGDNPTPDQSLKRMRRLLRHYEDNEELEFIDKIEKRDRDRFELEESSKATDDTIWKYCVLSVVRLRRKDAQRQQRTTDNRITDNGRLFLFASHRY